MRNLILTPLLALFVLCCHGQLLIDVGYSPSYYSLDVMKAGQKKFNQDRDWLDRELKAFHLLHGVHMRIKHRFDSWGPWIEVNYQLNSNKYEGTQPTNTALTTGKIKTSFLLYGLGLEWENNGFGMGAGLGNQKLVYRVKEETSNQKIDDELISASSTYVTAFINILPEIDPYNITNLVIQPFIVYPLSTNNFSAVADYFSLSDQAYNEKFWQVGLRLILSNGQR
jgi:hypothetical protein